MANEIYKALSFPTHQRRKGQCFFNWPSISDKPLTNERTFDAVNLGPLSQGFRFTVEQNPSVAAGIVALFRISGPFTVLRTVRSVIVDSIKSLSMRSFAHVLKEIFKRFTPANANEYPPTSIICKGLIAWVVASRFHARPNLVRCGVGHSMLDLHGGRNLRPQTATGFGVSRLKIMPGNYGSVAAVTLTKPIIFTSPFVSMRNGNNNQARKTTIRDIFQNRHGIAPSKLCSVQVGREPISTHRILPQSGDGS